MSAARLALSVRPSGELRCQNPDCTALLEVSTGNGTGVVGEDALSFLSDLLHSCSPDVAFTATAASRGPTDLMTAFTSLTTDPVGFAALLGQTFAVAPSPQSDGLSLRASYLTSRLSLPLCDACMTDTVRAAERLRDAMVEKREATKQFASKLEPFRRRPLQPPAISLIDDTPEAAASSGSGHLDLLRQPRGEEEKEALALALALEEEIEAEEKRLLKEIRSLRRKKEKLALQRFRLDAIKGAVTGRLRASVSTLRHDVSAMLSSARERMADLQDRDERSRHRLSRIRYLSVHNDAFFIWHAGPLVTINGFRLGRNLIAPPTAGSSSSSSSGSSGGGAGAGSGGFNSGIFGGGTPSFPGSLQQQFSTTAVVEKAELNAALGQVALLLTTIANRLGYNFQRYRIIPMGSYSRIAPAEDTKAMVELHFTGKMFSQGRLNAALKAMMVCIAELGDYAQSVDRSFWWPYPITHGGEKIADLSVSVAGSTLGGGSAVRDAQWSRAMKLALTNLKWLLAWAFRQA